MHAWRCALLPSSFSRLRWPAAHQQYQHLPWGLNTFTWRLNTAKRHAMGEVTTTSGQDYSVFMHRSKSELIISVSPKRAYRMGFAKGLTLGMAQETIPREEFEAAARKWFDQIGRPGCRTTGGRPLNAYYFEFHHNCGPWRGSRT
jgi:hypothetical protein